MNTAPARLIALLLAALPATSISAECTRAAAERATVPQIAANVEDYEHRCVIIDGVMSKASLFESVDGVYLQPPDATDPSSNGFRIGLDNLGKRWSKKYRHVTLVGLVQICQNVREIAHASAGEDEFVMVAGYCHSWDGAYLWIKELRFRSGPPFQRQMGSYERMNYGDLAPAPVDWPHRARIEALADQFLTALRTSDADELANLHFRNVGLEWEEDEAALLKFLLKDRKSPFAAVRQSTPQRMILADKWLLHPEDGESPDPDDYSSVICFCGTGDCTARWPIARFDADNIPSRPYACTEIGPYIDGDEVVPNFTTAIGEGGLAEPRAH